MKRLLCVCISLLVLLSFCSCKDGLPQPAPDPALQAAQDDAAIPADVAACEPTASSPAIFDSGLIKTVFFAQYGESSAPLLRHAEEYTHTDIENMPCDILLFRTSDGCPGIRCFIGNDLCFFGPRNSIFLRNGSYSDERFLSCICCGRRIATHPS